MADKTIGALNEAAIGGLPGIDALYDDTLIPVEQQGEARKMTGAQWRRYARHSAEQYLDGADGFAQQALEAAQAAQAAQKAVEDMTVSAETLAPGSQAAVTKTQDSGVVHLKFGIPRGEPGTGGGSVENVVTILGGAVITLSGDFGDPPYEIKITAEEGGGGEISKTCRLALSVDPSGGGAVSGAGTYPEGASVTVKAAAAGGFTFSGWKENGTTVSSDVNYTFTISGDTSLTAVFEKKQDSLGEWTLSAMPSGSYWYDAAFGNGVFAAVTYGYDKSAYSSDGVNWSGSTLPDAACWERVVYGNDKFVAVGGGLTGHTGLCAYSTDGETWSKADLPTTVGELHDITYGAGKFVAVGSTGAVYSVNGTEWEAANLSISMGFACVAYGNGKFVAIGGYTDDIHLFYSLDGVSWNDVSNTFTHPYSSIAFGNGKFVAVSGYGEIAYSEDGTAWETAALPESISAIGWRDAAYGNGKFVAISNDKSAWSPDGKTWTAMDMPVSANWAGIAYGDGKFAATANGTTAAYAEG